MRLLNPNKPVTPDFIWKDVLETPQLLLYASFLVFVWLCIGSVLHDIARLKNRLFWIVFCTLSVIRFLSTASGSIHYYTELQLWLPWDSGSFFKAWWLWEMLILSHWDWKFLEIIGRFDEKTAHEVAETTDKTTKTKITPTRPTWRDAIVRLAYYHIFDNAAHVVWLRFFWPHNDGKPFTEYISNSEILTVILTGLMVAWTWVQVQMRDWKETEGVVEMEEGREKIEKK
ncbi:hypothetical protein FB567DRAFT_453342 [Paraphoma chrysanthemicola]|uniref:Uncharacterized protein n=1 Tax=Paraphoma chrysanthemicola TaxID=798071 RepID=A0A8K0VTG1_9PLEO|nr:hypothetical protein FB567DRAFT_453342 [Paraphoma chrysanthemicola]